MNKRHFTKLDQKVSEIGLGCWQLGGDFGPIDDKTAEAILEKAVEEGITFFDTADVYGGGHSEELVGRVLNAKGRDAFTIATKVGRGGDLFPDNYSRDGIRSHVEACLQRLNTDVIDLIQLHCIPQEELRRGNVFEWLRELRTEGKIKAFGASVELVEDGLIALEQDDLASLQVIFNVFRQKPAEKLFSTAEVNGAAIIVRLPLNSGLLSGKFTRDTHFAESDHRHYNRDGDAFSVGETFGGIPFEKGIELVDELKVFCPSSYSMAEFAQRFILDHTAVTSVITGASRPEQVSMNARVSELDPLPGDIRSQMGEFYKNSVLPHIRGDQ